MQMRGGAWRVEVVAIKGAEVDVSDVDQAGEKTLDGGAACNDLTWHHLGCAFCGCGCCCSVCVCCEGLFLVAFGASASAFAIATHSIHVIAINVLVWRSYG